MEPTVLAAMHKSWNEGGKVTSSVILFFQTSNLGRLLHIEFYMIFGESVRIMLTKK